MAVLKRKLRVVGGEIVGSRRFEELDSAITDLVRDFVQLGQKLIEMRDEQAYRSAGFDTFEDYCKSKVGLSIRRSQEVILASLAYLAIDEGSGRGDPRPETMEQVKQIQPMATFNTEQRKVTTKDGIERTVEQTVGIANPEDVAEQWTKTVNKFEEKKAKAIKDHDGKCKQAEKDGEDLPKGPKLPTLSGTFVRNELPNKYKVAKNTLFACNPCVNMAGRLSKLKDALDDQGFLMITKLKPLLTKDPECLPPQTADLWNQCQEVRDRMNKLMELLEPHCDFTKGDINEFA